MKQSSQRRVSGVALILLVCLLPILFCYLLLTVRVTIGPLVVLLVMILCYPAMFHLMMGLTGQAICHAHSVDREFAWKVRLPDILRIVDLTSGRSQHRHEFAWNRHWCGGQRHGTIRNLLHGRARVDPGIRGLQGGHNTRHSPHE